MEDSQKLHVLKAVKIVMPEEGLPGGQRWYMTVDGTHVAGDMPRTVTHLDANEVEEICIQR
jgi:hypothetical protein